MPDYTLVYWPIPFRGHFARFVLAHAGATWDETGYDEVIAQKSLPVAEQPYPFMAPPLLVDHADGRRLSQLPAILMFLGRRHGLTGEPDRALRLICDAMDVLFEITRYHGAQMWDRGNWAAFVGGGCRDGCRCTKGCCATPGRRSSTARNRCWPTSR